MNEPWFSPDYFAWIPGTVLGTLGGLWGGMLGSRAPAGKSPGLVLGSGWALWIASALLTVAGGVAWLSGQPAAVYENLGGAGLIGVVVMSVLLPVAKTVYRQAEQRRIQAVDF